jgi:glycosyltransferase involved in cell wall biosynthesis
MNNKIVVLIKTNSLTVDPRLEKEIHTLIHGGYKVNLICWNRKGKLSREIHVEKDANYKEWPLYVRAPSGLKIIPFLPIWWFFVFFKLLNTKWDMLHVVNLDSVIPALCVGKLKHKPVIYEILDVYEDEIILPGIIRNFCLFFDKLYMRFSNAVIVADNEQINGINGIPNKVVIPVYDSPPIEFDQQRKDNNEAHNDFILFYAGVLFANRRLNLDKLFEAIRDIDGIKLVIAGYGDLVEVIKEWSKLSPKKVEYIGKISYPEVIKRGSTADLFFVLRDTLVPANRYTCGSTMFNSMLCGKPLLVNQGSSTARKVHEEKCGIIVNAHNVGEIKNAVVMLKNNPDLCRELGSNARKAYADKYNWEIMRNRLLLLYKQFSG